MSQTVMSSHATEQATQQAAPITIIHPQPSPTSRPVVEPVHGICGHIARSPRHTCGAWSCTQNWGW